MTTAKRSDVFGHTSDDDASASPPASPIQRVGNMKNERHPPDASLFPRSEGQVQYNSAQPGVPGMFARTGPVAQQTNRCSVDSFARPSAASMRDDLAPATSQPRISYALREFLSKKGGSPKNQMIWMTRFGWQ
jgi:hypothetical protein